MTDYSLAAPLQTLVPDQLWHACQPIRFGPFSLATRMTVARLADGGLWVHSPVTPAPALCEAMAALGSVRAVVAPNRSHHLFFRSFLQAFPQAQGWVAPGLVQKRPDLADCATLSAQAAPWADSLTGYFIDGLPLLNETVWFHHATRTLILTDLLFCIGPQQRGFGRLVARLLGVYDRLGMSRTMKLAVHDRVALARSVAPLLALDVARIVLAHDQVIERDARSRLADALAWLA